MNTEQRESWLMAIQEELENHRSLQTFTYVPERPNMRLLTGGWVFSIKTDQTGQHTRFKARLFVRGCAQPGGTYGVTSSPVAPVTMMRVMVAQAAKHGWTLAHVDFKAAYLNAPVRETLYTKASGGHERTTGICVSVAQGVARAQASRSVLVARSEGLDGQARVPAGASGELPLCAR